MTFTRHPEVKRVLASILAPGVEYRIHLPADTHPPNLQLMLAPRQSIAVRLK